MVNILLKNILGSTTGSVVLAWQANSIADGGGLANTGVVEEQGVAAEGPVSGDVTATATATATAQTKGKENRLCLLWVLSVAIEWRFNSNEAQTQSHPVIQQPHTLSQTRAVPSTTSPASTTKRSC